jgi:CRISPR/Cas system-associated exonuclease Cas4 (RecB family)
MTLPLYQMLGPTAWAIPPSSYSYSSLTAIERCPRQWQLAHSRYGNLARFPTRPHPAAVEGEIVHAVLDRLFKALAVRGMPALGTLSFREGLAEVDIQRSVRHLVVEHERRLADHPRASSFRLRTSPQQLVNQVIRLFRGLYQDAVTTHLASDLPAVVMRAPLQLPSGPALAALLRERGALSELSLVHPTLPFGGIIDLIWSDRGESVITDFKTGQEKPEHKKQVAYYAVLWWRCSGVIPGRAEVRYPDRSIPVSLEEALLVEVEEELCRRVSAVATMLASTPTQAVLGEHCRHCDVRQFCDAYWAGRKSLSTARKLGASQDIPVDVEVSVVGEPSGSGFDALTGDAAVFPVVFRENVALVHGPFAKGERLRILGARATEYGGLELKPWTEVFHHTPTDYSRKDDIGIQR